ncbi:hypothetical protein IGI04_007236 [Brassica rapa subsp. trilocularis]|uniref:Uncharacterized protein n=1 Tax=Brassica rapa subsp. trilocularis TaxID=1813537 RepID=A0ABQ7NJ65_BRACM|nr:hypothetical protein IGI04_007236 [Brassica rapa subsp. trilocularis]
MMQGFSNKYLDLQSKSAYIARSLPKIGQTSMNKDLMVVATKSSSLLFDLYPRIICEASLIDCSHQVRIRSHVYQDPRQAVVSSLVLEVSFGSFRQSQQV